MTGRAYQTWISVVSMLMLVAIVILATAYRSKSQLARAWLESHRIEQVVSKDPRFITLSAAPMYAAYRWRFLPEFESMIMIQVTYEPRSPDEIRDLKQIIEGQPLSFSVRYSSSLSVTERNKGDAPTTQSNATSK